MQKLSLFAVMLSSCLVAPTFAADWGDLKLKFVQVGAAKTPAKVNVNKDQAFCGKHNLKEESLVVGKDGAWGVVIPDFPGCHGGGATVEEAVQDATSALSEFASLMIRDGEKVPAPRSIDEVLNEYNSRTGEKRAGGVYIPLIVERGQMVRANLSIDAGLLQAIDDEAKRRGITRSAFMTNAAREKIEQAR